MAIDWSDGITLAQLADEPALSEELSALLDRVGGGAGPVPHLVLDFSGVSYINSSNIAQLLRLRTRVAEAKRQLRLCGLSDEVWSVVLVTGLDKVFRFSPDTLSALAGIQLEDPALSGAGDEVAE